MGRKRWAERRAKQAEPVLVEIDEATWFHAGVLQCGYPLGDGAMCMVPASAEHVAKHEKRTDWGKLPPLMPGVGVVAVAGASQAVRGAIDAERQLAQGAGVNDVFDPFAATAKAPAGSGAPAGEMDPSLYRELTGRPYPPATRFAAAQASVAKVLAATPAEVAEMAKKATALYRPPTYETLKAAAVERAQFTAEQAQELLSAALGTRPHLAARVIDRLGPVLAGELARAVDASVAGRINRYLAEERATLDRLYADQLAKLQADQERRGRDVNAERWTTPSRLS